MPGIVLSAPTDAKHGITKYQLTWVSDASGNVSGMPVTLRSGTIVSVEFVPGAGATAPDALYDVDMIDVNGISMFDNGAGTTIGANLSAVVASVGLPLFGQTGTTPHRRWHPGGPVQLLVAGAGDTNSGVVNIYILGGVL